jgi:hypothetical protein
MPTKIIKNHTKSESKYLSFCYTARLPNQPGIIQQVKLNIQHVIKALQLKALPVS